MPAGLQVFNNAGIVQIDQDWLNFALIEKGTVTLTTALGAGWANARYAEFTRSGLINPVVAFRANGDQAVSILNTIVSGANRTFRFVGLGGEVVTWWLFDSVDVAGSLPGIGFEVKRADGATAFHSALPCLRVVGQTTGAALSLPAGRDYALVQSATRINKISVSIDTFSRRTTRMTMPRFNASGTLLTTEAFTMNTQNVALEGESAITGPQITLTAVDVTGL